MARSSHPTPPVARSYDEIVRRTVPEPDGSWRPSLDQERAALEGVHEDQLLRDRLTAAVAAVPDAGALSIELDRGRVTLHGQVRDLRWIAEIERRIDAVDGVTAIENRLVVAAG